MLTRTQTITLLNDLADLKNINAKLIKFIESISNQFNLNNTEELHKFFISKQTEADKLIEEINKR